MRLQIPKVTDDVISLRTATRRDEARLLACLTGCDDYRKKFTAHRSTEEWLDALLEEAERDDSRKVCLVTSVAGDSVGVMELVQDDPSQLTIALLAVPKAHRIRGFGRRAVKLLAKHAQRRDTTHLAIGVAQKNTAAIAFWETLGFAETSVIGTKQERLVNMMTSIEELLS